MTEPQQPTKMGPKGSLIMSTTTVTTTVKTEKKTSSPTRASYLSGYSSPQRSPIKQPQINSPLSPIQSPRHLSPRTSPRQQYSPIATPSSVNNSSISTSSISALNSSTTTSTTNKRSTTSSQISQLPGLVKSETRNLLKKLESSTDDLKAIEELYALCLFQVNRMNMLDSGILSALVYALRTKSNRIKEISARILQLFAQDGGEACIQLRQLSISTTLIEILTKIDDLNVQIPIVGLIYWVLQHPPCKRELVELGADSYLREVNSRSKDALLAKFVNHALNSMSPKVKSREEMMDEVLANPALNVEPAVNQSAAAQQQPQQQEIQRETYTTTVYTSTPSPRGLFGFF